MLPQKSNVPKFKGLRSALLGACLALFACGGVPGPGSGAENADGGRAGYPGEGPTRYATPGGACTWDENEPGACADDQHLLTCMEGPYPGYATWSRPLECGLTQSGTQRCRTIYRPGQGHDGGMYIGTHCLQDAKP